MRERDVTPPSVERSDVPTVPAPRTSPENQPERLSVLAAVGVAALGGLALGWFLVSWRLLGSPLTDAIGETVGSLAVVLLVVSIVGVTRRR